MPAQKRKGTPLRRTTAVDAKKRPRAVMRMRNPNPHPPPSRSPVNSKTVKSKTFVPVAYNASNVVGATGITMDVVARGDQSNERIGHKWRDVALHLKGTYKGVSPGDTYAGYYIVWDKQPNLAVPRFGDVFSGQVGYEFASLVGAERYVIIHQKKFTSPDAAGLADNTVATIDDYIPLPRGLIPTCQLGGAGTGQIGTRMTNSLIMFPYSNYGTGAGPEMIMSHRIYFEDV